MSTFAPTVSVVLCTYNGAAYISQQLESILSQTTPVNQLVICDDCSTDATCRLVDDLTRDYPGPTEIEFIRNTENLGVIRNFEKAIMRATGDIIFLSDQDDVWFGNKVARMVSPFMQDEAVGLVYCNAIVTDAQLSARPDSLFGVRKWLKAGNRRSLSNIIRLDVGTFGCTIAFRSSLNKHILPINSDCWPHDSWIGFIAYAVSEVECISEPLMYYRRHDANVSEGTDLGSHSSHILKALQRTPSTRYDAQAQPWQDMLQQLHTISAAMQSDRFPYRRMNESMHEVEARVEFACGRARIGCLDRSQRIRLVCRLLRKGYYRSYATGVLSAIKDVCAR